MPLFASIYSKGLLAYVGDRSSVSSKCKFSVHQTVVPRNHPSSWRLLLSLYSFPLTLVHLGPPRSVAGAGWLLSYSTFAERVSFCLAEHRQLPSSHAQSWFAQLSFPTPKDRTARPRHNTAQHSTSGSLTRYFLSLLFSKAHRPGINALTTHCTHSQLNFQSTKAKTSKYWQELEAELEVTQVEVAAPRWILSSLVLLTK